MVRKRLFWAGIVLAAFFAIGFFVVFIREGYPSKVIRYAERIIGTPTAPPYATLSPDRESDPSASSSSYVFLQDMSSKLIYKSWMKSMQGFNADQVFIGDSLVLNGDWQDLLPEQHITCIAVGGAKTVDIVNMLPLIEGLTPKTVYIMIGINDIFLNYSRAYTMEQYELILQELTSITKDIYVFSILPTRDRWAILNGRINQTNIALHELTEKYHCMYIDLHANYLDSNGVMKQSLCLQDDGIHLSYEGYLVWSDVVQKSIGIRD